jgi:hypothetical protein
MCKLGAVCGFLCVTMLVRRLTSGAIVAAYLLATTASGLLHDHAPFGVHLHVENAHGGHLHSCHLHGNHLHRHRAHDHHLHDENLHEHVHETESGESQTGHSEHDHESLPPFHDHDCPACQFVGQLSLPVAVVGLTLSAGIVTEIREIAPDSWFDVSLDCPRSRGPPA